MKDPDFKARLAKLETELEKRGLDSFLVTNETNVSYLSSFKGRDAVLLVTLKKRYFLTDSRYLEEAEDQVKGFTIKLVTHSTYTTLSRLVRSGGLKRIGFESMNLPYEVASRLARLIGHARLVPTKDVVERFRAVKEGCEIALIKKAANLTMLILNDILNFVRPGVSEAFLSRKVELEFIKNGVHPSFEPIIASSANSSKPHASPTDDVIRNNSFVMMDVGCVRGGYNSDLTRMVVLGKASDRFKKIYNIVSSAQRKAIDKIRPGVKISNLDLTARRYIEVKGFGKYFGHSLGHGVGMEVHEWPSVSKRNEEILMPGMVMTIEPAIYIPGFGGARVEDMVLVTDKGCEVLTR